MHQNEFTCTSGNSQTHMQMNVHMRHIPACVYKHYKERQLFIRPN